MRPTLFILAAVLLVSAPVSAEPTEPVTLSAVIARAVAGSPTLATASLSLDQAEAARQTARGAYDPTLEVSGSAARARQRTTILQPLADDVLDAGATVTKAFEGGATAQLQAGVRREFSTTPVASASGIVEVDQRTVVPRLVASLSDPLWGGRGTGAAIRERVTAARDAAAFERIATAARVLRDVEHAYWQLYLAQREVAIRHDATAAVEIQLRQALAEIARGSRARLGAAEIEEEVARRREDELVAEGAVGERSLELAHAIGATPTTRLRASDLPAPRDAAALSQLGVAAMPEVRAAELRGEAARAEVAQAEDEARWRVDATVTGTLSAYGEHARAAFADTADLGGWSVQLGVTVRVPLADRAPRGKVDGAHARWLAARIERDDATAQLAAEIERQRNRLAIARQRRLALARACEHAEDLAAEQGRWDRGETTAFEILRRQAALSDVRIRIERAQIDELDADAALAAASGDLLARHGVTLR